ncbi:hypothetical protein BIY45_07515 [Stenotrophomonas sp. BIIR7]|nr:hypothetical protein BIY45_07515 [Stenotrophomonas sp. BIIR7]
MENVGNAVPVISYLPVPSVIPAATTAHGVATPDRVYNAQGFQGMPPVPMGEHCVRLSDADHIVSALYKKIVKTGLLVNENADLSGIGADLGTLSAVLAASVFPSDSDDPQRVSNIYLGKALKILCQLVRRSGTLPFDSRQLQRAGNRAIAAIRARQDFTLENLSVIMFHLGELINHRPLQESCSHTITRHLQPIFEAKLAQLPAHAVTGTCLAFGLVSTLRASEHQMVRPVDGVLPRPAADSLLLRVPELLQKQPNQLLSWESRTLALVARYGVQYLRRLGPLGASRRCKVGVDILELNAAYALKPIIEEARVPSRGVWDQRNCEFHGFGEERNLREDLAYSSKYYCEWLGKQKERVQARLALQEAVRGPLPDNPHDGRRFSEVVRAGIAVAPAATTPAASAAATQAAYLGRPLSAEAEPWGPPTELVAFTQAANELIVLGGAADRRDRQEAISATNSLIVAVLSGRITLDGASRVQLLLDMDSVCLQLHLADPIYAPQYGLQLSGMRSFMVAQLNQLVDRNGRPLVGGKLGFEICLASWQRTLLGKLNDHNAAT